MEEIHLLGYKVYTINFRFVCKFLLKIQIKHFEVSKL